MTDKILVSRSEIIYMLRNIINIDKPELAAYLVNVNELHALLDKAAISQVEPDGYVITSKLGERCGFKATNVNKGDTIYTSPPADKKDAEIATLRENLIQANKDVERLNFLDSINDTLNRHYQTNYGFKLVRSHNVIRIYSKSVNHIDLNDTNSWINKYTKVREAIDTAMKGE